MTTWQNWARTATASPAEAVHPAGVEEVQRVVVDAGRRGLVVKAVGSGHSGSEVAVTTGVHVHLDRMRGIRDADPGSGLVTVRAGTVLHDLGPELWRLGLSMSNLGDVDVQTLAGAIATGTHGTTGGSGVPAALHSAVAALEIVLADGTLLTCSAEEHPDVFAAALVGLGALGVVTAVTLRCEPAFLLHAVEVPMPLDEVLARLDELRAAHDHVEAYWFPHTERVQVKLHRRVSPAVVRHGSPGARLGRARRAVEDGALHNAVFEGLNRVAAHRPGWIRGINELSSRGLMARSFLDRSYRVLATDRTVVFREMELALPRDALDGVVRGLQAWWARTGERVAFPLEIRLAGPDDAWMGPAHGRETAWLSVQQHERRDHARYFRAAAELGAEVGARPHWGKSHDLDAEALRAVHPRFDDFLAVRDRLDPQRRFGSAHLRRILGD